MLKSESESRRFRLPKSAFQESDSANEAVPFSTLYKNNRAVNRGLKIAVDFSKDYELDKVQALSADIAEMDDLSLNSWASKFVFILWTLMIKGTAKVFR